MYSRHLQKKTPAGEASRERDGQYEYSFPQNHKKKFYVRLRTNTTKKYAQSKKIIIAAIIQILA